MYDKIKTCMSQLTADRYIQIFHNDLTGTKGGGWPHYQWSNLEKYDFIYHNIPLIIDNKQYDCNWIKQDKTVCIFYGM